MLRISFIIFFNLFLLINCANHKESFIKRKNHKTIQNKNSNFSLLSKLTKGFIYGLLGSKLIENVPLVNTQFDDIHEFISDNFPNNFKSKSIS